MRITKEYGNYLIIVGRPVDDENGWGVPDAYVTPVPQEWLKDLTALSEFENDPDKHPERWRTLKASVWGNPDRLHDFETPREAEYEALRFAEEAIKCGFNQNKS